MLREMVVMIAFMLALAGISGSLVFVQEISERQVTQVEEIMEAANEID